MEPMALTLVVEVEARGRSSVVEMGARGKIVVGANIDVHRL